MRPVASLIRLLLALLTILEIVMAVIPGGPPAFLRDISVALLAVFVVAAVLQARRSTKILVVCLGSAIAALLWPIGNIAPIINGLADSLVFAAFMPVLQIIRGAANRSPAVARARLRFATLDKSTAATGYTLGSLGIASVLTTGAHAVLASLVPDDATGEERRSAALASLRGVAIATFWSPFFVPMAYAAHHLPDVQTYAVLASGLGFCALAILFNTVMFGTDGDRRSAMLPTLAAAWRGLVPLLPTIATAALLVVFATVVTKLTTLEAVIVVMPFASLALIAAHEPNAVLSTLLETYDGLSRVSDEVLLIVFALSLGRVLEATPAMTETLAPIFATLPNIALMGAVMVTMILSGLIGIHPLISTAALFAIYGSVHPHIVELCLMQAVLIAWGFSTMLSPSGITVMIAGVMFNVPYVRLAMSRNLAFAGIFTVGSLVLLAGADWILRNAFGY